MTFRYNGTRPASINFNGSPVSYLKYKGTLVWTASPIVPVGLIMPFIGATPASWSTHNMNGRYIMGALGGRAPGTTENVVNQSISLTPSFATSFNGDHGTNGAIYGPPEADEAFNSDTARPDNPAGGHDHDWDLGDWILTARYYGMKFVKKTTDDGELLLPSGAVATRTSASGQGYHSLITNFSTFGDQVPVLRDHDGGSVAGEGGDNVKSASGTTTTNGAHRHRRSGRYGEAGTFGEVCYATESLSGGHNHGISGDFRISLMRRYVALYELLQQAPSNIGDCFFYEGSTAPPDWVICDGTNGTPDFRDYFISPVDDEADLSQSPEGSNKVFADLNVTAKSAHHSHSAQNQMFNGESQFLARECGHTDSRGSHDHSSGFSPPTHRPKNIALTVITPDPDFFNP